MASRRKGAKARTRASEEYPGATWYTDCRDVRRWRYRAGNFAAELGRDYGSAEFIRRYEAACRRQREWANPLRHGTVSWLIAELMASPAFLDLAPSTRHLYRRRLDRFRAEHGDRQVAGLTRRVILKLMGRRHATPNDANLLLRMISLLFKHAIEIGLVEHNPAAGVKKYRTNGPGIHTWEEQEISAFEARYPLGSIPRLAFTLMLYTGASRADACRLGWSNIRGGRLTYQRQKTSRMREAVLVDIPLHPELEAALAAIPRARPTFLHTQQKAPRSPKGLGTAMRDWCDAAGLPACSSHGLRKACARRLAEAGASANEIQAVTGHTTLKEVARYTKAADRSRMADRALAKLLGAPKTGEPDGAFA